MENGDNDNGRKAPPMSGLSVLTLSEVEMIDRLVREVCAVGYGTVKITIESGRPRFISQTRSEELKPAGI